MPFVFPLQRLLEMRKEAVDEAGRALDELNDSCERLRALLQTELDAYFSEREMFNTRSREGSFSQLNSIERALDARKKRMMDVMTSLRELEDEARRAEQTLILAKRELKIIENLREKREKEWVVGEDRKEARFLDELSTLRYARRARAGMSGGDAS